MPVSRGGGFSGGGSSSSFSSSGSHSSPSTHISRKPYPGAMMYTFMNRRGQECRYYSASVPKRQKISDIILFMCGILIVAIGLCTLLIYSSYPRKISARSCNPTGVYYEDYAGIVEHDEAFNAAMKAFYDKTGVEPFLLTLKEEGFPTSVYGELTKNTLEEYAFDRYVERFGDDEGHYMICYVIPNNGEYMWLEMAGTDTTGLLDDTVFESFQANMNSKLNQTENKELAIAECMLIMSDEAFVRTGYDVFLFVFGIVLAIGGAAGIAIGTIVSIKQAQDINDYCDYAEIHGQPFNFDESSEIKVEAEQS